MSRQAVHEAVTSEYVQKLIRIKAKQLRRRPEFRGAEMEDIRQELALHILQKADLFDPARGAVTTFSARVVDTAIAMMCRDRKRLKRGVGVPVQSLEDTACVGEDGEDVTFAETVQETDLSRRSGSYLPDESARRLLAADISEALGHLAQHCQEIARLMMAGAREAAIAAELGVSRRQVRNAIAAIRACLEVAGLRSGQDSDATA